MTFNYLTFILFFFTSILLSTVSVLATPQLIPSGQTSIVIPGGDTTGNGSGPDIKKTIAIESRFSSIIDQCLNSKICGLTKDESILLTSFLKDIRDEALVEFVTSATHPMFIMNKNLEKLYLTGDRIGSSNFINSRALVINSDQDAFTLLISIYANHFDNSVQKGLNDVLVKLLDWIDRIGSSSSMGFWSQYHIQFFSPNHKMDSLILTDGQFEKQFTKDDFFISTQDCNISLLPVKWVIVNKGHSIAVGHYTKQCKNQALEMGQIEYRIDFKDGVDWIQFESDSKSVTLQIEKVSWQKSVF